MVASISCIYKFKIKTKKSGKRFATSKRKNDVSNSPNDVLIGRLQQYRSVLGDQHLFRESSENKGSLLVVYYSSILTKRHTDGCTQTYTLLVLLMRETSVVKRARSERKKEKERMRVSALGLSFSLSLLSRSLSLPSRSLYLSLAAHLASYKSEPSATRPVKIKQKTRNSGNSSR